MAIVIINPNSTAAMTEAMVAAASAAAPSLAFEGWTSHRAPPAIQGAQDGEAATPPLLDLVQSAEAKGADGIIIGCFDDTALSQAAKIASCPVVGLGQAAYHYCALRQWRFSVVTTMPVSVPILEGNIQNYGLSGWLRQVRASSVPVLDLEFAPDRALKPILNEVREASRTDWIDALVLGCAGMVAVTSAVRASTKINVVEPVEAAASCMVWLSRNTGQENATN